MNKYECMDQIVDEVLANEVANYLMVNYPMFASELRIYLSQEELNASIEAYESVEDLRKKGLL